MKYWNSYIKRKLSLFIHRSSITSLSKFKSLINKRVTIYIISVTALFPAYDRKTIKEQVVQFFLSISLTENKPVRKQESCFKTNLWLSPGLGKIIFTTRMVTYELSLIQTSKTTRFSPLKLKFWHRYVDNIFSTWPHGPSALRDFFSHLNSSHPNIQFSIELERDWQLPFFACPG
jgi:hypothetical protein